MTAFRATEQPNGTFQAGTRLEKTGRHYDPALSALFRSGRARDYFRQVPLTCEALAADMARLAYCSYARDGALLQSFLTPVGFRLRGLPYDDGDTQAFLAEGCDGLVLACRGSDDLRAWLRNLRTRPGTWRGPGKVHRGFARAAQRLFDHFSPALSQTPPGQLLFCGHSLGAALALLVGFECGQGLVYGFGSPRVGNQDFVSAVQAQRELTVHRYVNHRDPVCHLPPRLLGYRDCGIAHFIDQAGRLGAAPPDLQREDWAEIARIWSSIEDGMRVGFSGRRSDLTDHAPINYVSALR